MTLKDDIRAIGTIGILLGTGGLFILGGAMLLDQGKWYGVLPILFGVPGVALGAFAVYVLIDEHRRDRGPRA